MQNKMSFTLFNEHKKKMIELLNNAQAYMEEHENDENFDQQVMNKK